VWRTNTDNNQAVYNWIKENQTEIGLNKTNENSSVLSTYDNALAAIVYTVYGDYDLADRIFDFFEGKMARRQSLAFDSFKFL
jgi:hypothetical protein